MPDEELNVISRFHVRKRIIVGSLSQWIPPGTLPLSMLWIFVLRRHCDCHFECLIVLAKRDNERNTHRWMIYVRGPEQELDISTFVKKVVVYLHESFAPNDAVTVEEPPFFVQRRYAK